MKMIIIYFVLVVLIGSSGSYLSEGLRNLKKKKESNEKITFELWYEKIGFPITAIVFLIVMIYFLATQS